MGRDVSTAQQITTPANMRLAEILNNSQSLTTPTRDVTYRDIAFHETFTSFAPSDKGLDSFDMAGNSGDTGFSMWGVTEEDKEEKRNAEILLATLNQIDRITGGDGNIYTVEIDDYSYSTREFSATSHDFITDNGYILDENGNPYMRSVNGECRMLEATNVSNTSFPWDPPAEPLPFLNLRNPEIADRVGAVTVHAEENWIDDAKNMSCVRLDSAQGVNLVEAKARLDRGELDTPYQDMKADGKALYSSPLLDAAAGPSYGQGDDVSQVLARIMAKPKSDADFANELLGRNPNTSLMAANPDGTAVNSPVTIQAEPEIPAPDLIAKVKPPTPMAAPSF